MLIMLCSLMSFLTLLGLLGISANLSPEYAPVMTALLRVFLIACVIGSFFRIVHIFSER